MISCFFCQTPNYFPTKANATSHPFYYDFTCLSCQAVNELEEFPTIHLIRLEYEYNNNWLIFCFTNNDPKFTCLDVDKSSKSFTLDFYPNINFHNISTALPKLIQQYNSLQSFQ